MIPMARETGSISFRLEGRKEVAGMMRDKLSKFLGRYPNKAGEAFAVGGG
jgi:hypothetical protein